MILQAPDIDPRNAADIDKQVRELLAIYAPEWKEFDPATGKPQGMSAALIGIFARFCEIIIQRLNKVPEKNLLAFLDMLGASLLPPQPARVPLTFFMAAGSTDAAVVPAGTQVAAPPAEGEKDPVIFETEQELAVTPAQLVAIYTRNPEQDLYADRSAIIASTATNGVPIFQGDSRIEHILYIGHSTMFSYPALNTLCINFVLDEIQKPVPRSVQWEIWDGIQGKPVGPTSDTTVNLTQTGDVVFENLPLFPAQIVASVESRWLRCRLLTPITPSMVNSNQLPQIKSITMQGTINRTGLILETAIANLLIVDLSKEFFPFGEKPRFGDTLYLAKREAFSAFADTGATITLNIDLVNPTTSNISPITPTKASKDLMLQWEFWNGSTWKPVGTSSPEKSSSSGSNTFTDTTKAFTFSGEVTFILPEKPSATIITGTENFWIRVRIVAGNYGTEAQYAIDPSTPTGYKFVPATFAPPSIKSVTVDYNLTTSDRPPEAIVTYNDFAYQQVSSEPFMPFQRTADAKPTLYLGFTPPPPQKVFPNRTLSLYFRTTDIVYGGVPDNPSPASPQRLSWEYWNGTPWAKLTVRDDSENFTRPGMVEFLAPQNFASHGEFGLPPLFWLRTQWQSGEYDFNPRLSHVLLNTTMAAQTVTIKNEILGSSDQSKNQKFQTTRKPILSGQQLEVREPEMPSAEEQIIIKKDEGKDAISVIPDAAGRPKEIWVRWHEAPDFYGSGPRDRHYVVDHLSGEISFGNGLNGMIPPRGTGNIRMTLYKSGGGAAGNRPAGAITQLKTTVPYVEKVANYEPSTGGADAEILDSLLERAPRAVRHRNRSVTLEDYQDLAMLASPEVARARCVPLRNLSADHRFGNVVMPGEVSVIIAPRTKDAKPLPNLELITRVQKHLIDHGIPTANVSVVGPLHLCVDVATEIALVSLEGASAVELAVRQELEKFLHPLTGGLDGKGWDFGREPYKSDLYALIEPIPGVDHIRSLKLNDTREDPDGAIKKTGRFLVYSGNHRISLEFG